MHATKLQAPPPTCLGRYMNPADPEHSLLRLISRHPALRLRKYAEQQGVPPGGLLCFKVSKGRAFGVCRGQGQLRQAS